MADEPRPHYFHAEAHALKGKVESPISAEVRPQAYVKLAGTLQELSNGEGPRTYYSQQAKNYRLEGIFSYSAAHTQVSGHASSKIDGASVTLATSVVENLNILNVVTADRVVAQISTTHLPDKYVPEVTFLGTHFENLKVARHKVKPILNLKMIGSRSAEDKLYLVNDKADEINKSTLMDRIKRQHQALSPCLEAKRGELHPTLAGRSLETQYHWGEPNYEEVIKEVTEARETDEDPKNGYGNSKGVTFSLVEDVVIEPISDDNKTASRDLNELVEAKCGHIIHIPDFGLIFLGELTVNHNSFQLTMVRVEMGCIANGSGSMAYATVNGKGSKGGGG